MPKIGDRFNPSELWEGIYIVNPVLVYRGISPGAKIVWGRLYRFSGKKGEIYPRVQTVADDIGLSINQTRKYIQELVEDGFLEIDKDPGRSNNYFFIWHPAYNGEKGFIRMQPPLQDAGGVENLEPLQDAGGPTPTGCCMPPLQDAGGRREELREDLLNTSPVVPVQENQTQNTPKETPDTEDLIGDGRRGFISNAYRRAGRPNPKLHTRASERIVQELRNAEDSHCDGRDGFRQRLLEFLDQTDDFAKSKAWAPWLFLERLKQGGAFRHSGYQRSSPVQPALFSDTCPTLDTSPRPTQASSEKQRLIALWNSAVPSHAFTDPERHLTLHHEHAEMMEKFTEVVNKSAAIVKGSPECTWLTLRWVCGDKDGYPNWRKLLSGTLDFKAQQRGRGGGKSNLTVEDIDQYYAEKKLKRETEEKSKEFLADANLSANRF